jgi:hypothetical protein
MGVDVMRDQKLKLRDLHDLVYTGLCGGLGHLKIETRLRGERFESVMGECVI